MPEYNLPACGKPKVNVLATRPGIDCYYLPILIYGDKFKSEVTGFSFNYQICLTFAGYNFQLATVWLPCRPDGE